MDQPMYAVTTESKEKTAGYNAPMTKRVMNIRANNSADATEQGERWIARSNRIGHVVRVQEISIEPVRSR